MSIFGPPPPPLSSSAYNLDFRKLLLSVIIYDQGQPVVLTNVLSAEYTYSIDRVPTARIRVRQPIPVAAHYFSDVSVYGGTASAGTALVFRGKILNVNPDAEGATIECVGLSWPLDVSYHKTVLTINNQSSATVIATLLAAAGITDYYISMPAWTTVL